MNESKERIPSPAKAAVAQQKPRDDKGRFLSGEELQAYQINQQAQMQQMEREKISRMLGKSGIPNGMQIGNSMPVNSNVPSNFAAILAANRPGQINDNEKLATLLGKKKRMM